MKIHEYQAKAILTRYGVTTPRGEVAYTKEEAKRSPEAILREPIQPVVGLQPYQARKIAFGLGLPGEVATHATPFFQALYRAFIDTDASLLEINPCVLTGDGKLVALDAKMTFDDNALFRHPNLRELRDLDE